jgi:hypothetical protein
VRDDLVRQRVRRPGPEIRLGDGHLAASLPKS